MQKVVKLKTMGEHIGKLLASLLCCDSLLPVYMGPLSHWVNSFSPGAFINVPKKLAGHYSISIRPAAWTSHLLGTWITPKRQSAPFFLLVTHILEFDNNPLFKIFYPSLNWAFSHGACSHSYVLKIISKIVITAKQFLWKNRVIRIHLTDCPLNRRVCLLNAALSEPECRTENVSAWTMSGFLCQGLPSRCSQRTLSYRMHTMGRGQI